MADKNIILHPYKSDGTQDNDTNLYPKTKASLVDGLPEGDTDIEFVGDSNNVLQEVTVGDETFTVPQGTEITVDQTYNAQSTNPQSGTAVAGAISGKQDTIDSSHKLSADLVQDGSTNKVVTSSEKSTWNGKQNALSTAQLNATNSGITASKVTTYDGYSSNKLNVAPNGSDNLILNNKINSAYIPDSLLGALHFKGAWDASSSGDPSYTPQRGEYWICTGEGNKLPTGVMYTGGFQVGDWALYNNALIGWVKVDNVDAVTMVNDQIGSVHTYKGVWIGNTKYYAGDFVKDSNNVVYLCIQTGTGIALSNTSYWYSFAIPDIPQGETDIEFETDSNNNLTGITVGDEEINVVTPTDLAGKLTASKQAVANVGGLVTPTAVLASNELVGVGVNGEQVRIQLGEGLTLEGSTSPYTLKASGGGGGASIGGGFTLNIDDFAVGTDILVLSGKTYRKFRDNPTAPEEDLQDFFGWHSTYAGLSRIAHCENAVMVVFTQIVTCERLTGRLRDANGTIVTSSNIQANKLYYLLSNVDMDCTD